jgi:hypothetical protein
MSPPSVPWPTSVGRAHRNPRGALARDGHLRRLSDRRRDPAPADAHDQEFPRWSWALRRPSFGLSVMVVDYLPATAVPPGGAVEGHKRLETREIHRPPTVPRQSGVPHPGGHHGAPATQGGRPRPGIFHWSWALSPNDRAAGHPAAQGDTAVRRGSAVATSVEPHPAAGTETVPAAGPEESRGRMHCVGAGSGSRGSVAVPSDVEPRPPASRFVRPRCGHLLPGLCYSSRGPGVPATAGSPASTSPTPAGRQAGDGLHLTPDSVRAVVFHRSTP